MPTKFPLGYQPKTVGETLEYLMDTAYWLIREEYPPVGISSHRPMTAGDVAMLLGCIGLLASCIETVTKAVDSAMFEDELLNLKISLSSH
jgi:hypothetical protein